MAQTLPSIFSLPSALETMCSFPVAAADTGGASHKTDGVLGVNDSGALCKNVNEWSVAGQVSVYKGMDDETDAVSGSLKASASLRSDKG